MVTANYELTLL